MSEVTYLLDGVVRTLYPKWAWVEIGKHLVRCDVPEGLWLHTGANVKINTVVVDDTWAKETTIVGIAETWA
jgi:hypothetical protein